MEIALAYQHLLEQYGLTQERLSERVGKKRTTIANYLRLLKLPAPVQMGLQNKQIDMGHARALVTLDDPKLQVKIYEEILEHVIQGLEMNAEDGEKAKRLIKVNYIRKRLYIAFNAGLADVANEQFKKLKAEGKPTFRDRMYRFCANNQWAKKLIKRG